jgi:hypothetical protein
MAVIQVGVPPGFSTPSDRRQVTATVTGPRIFVTNATVGKDLQISASVSLEVAPANPVDITLLVGSDAIARISTSATTAGTAGVTFTGVNNTTSRTFFAQGIDLGNTTVTAQALGYVAGAGTIDVHPSGFVFSTVLVINTTSLAANTSLTVNSVRLAPTTLISAGVQPVRAGLTVDVPVTSSDTAVGTITVSPVSFLGNQSGVTTAFDPQTAGTTVLEVGVPPGFSTPASLRQRTANVTAPFISAPSATVGKDLQGSINITLQNAPPTPVNVTVTSNAMGTALVSTSATVAGSQSVTFTNISGTFVGTLWVQGIAVGGTTLLVEAPGYASTTSNVTVDPSGFVHATSSNINTTSFAANTTLAINSARLNPSTFAFALGQPVRAGITVDVTITSSDTAVGTITVSPISFIGNQSSANSAFDPQGPGTTLLEVGVPAGFSMPSNFRQRTANVTAPAITVGASTVGKDLQQSISITLQNAPPNPVDVTVTSDSGLIAIVSKDGTLQGANSVVFTNVTTTSVGTVFVQGLGLGQTNVRAQAAGYAEGVGAVTVNPSGFVINSPGNFTTTAAAANTNVQIAAARLDPVTLNRSVNQPLRGGLQALVEVTSSNTAAGTITTSPVTFLGNVTTVNTSFNPQAPGTSNIGVVQPAGFTLPNNLQQITATVN